MSKWGTLLALVAAITCYSPCSTEEPEEETRPYMVELVIENSKKVVSKLSEKVKEELDGPEDCIQHCEDLPFEDKVRVNHYYTLKYSPKKENENRSNPCGNESEMLFTLSYTDSSTLKMREADLFSVAREQNPSPACKDVHEIEVSVRQDHLGSFRTTSFHEPVSNGYKCGVIRLEDSKESYYLINDIKSKNPMRYIIKDRDLDTGEKMEWCGTKIGHVPCSIQFLERTSVPINIFCSEFCKMYKGGMF